MRLRTNLLLTSSAAAERITSPTEADRLALAQGICYHISWLALMERQTVFILCIMKKYIYCFPLITLKNNIKPRKKPIYIRLSGPVNRKCSSCVSLHLRLFPYSIVNLPIKLWKLTNKSDYTCAKDTFQNFTITLVLHFSPILHGINIFNTHQKQKRNKNLQ